MEPGLLRVVGGITAAALFLARWVWIVRRYRVGSLGALPLKAALADVATGCDAWIRRWLGRWPWDPRFITASFLAALALGAAVLVPGAYAYAENAGWIILFTGRHFAGPIVLAGWLSAATVALLLRRAATRVGLPTQLMLPFLSLLVALLSWAAAAHLGLWLHWRRQFSPFGFATEWHYAEVYITYVREPPGRMILAATLLPPLAPALFHLEMLVSHGVAAGAAHLWHTRPH